MRRLKTVPSIAFHRVEPDPKGGEKDVQRGTVYACPKSLHGGRHERPGGVPRVRSSQRHRSQDAQVRRSARLPQAQGAQKIQDRSVHRSHRRDTALGHESAEEAETHRQAHLRAVEGRAWVRGQVHHRQGLRARASAHNPGDVRSTFPSRRPRPAPHSGRRGQ